MNIITKIKDIIKEDIEGDFEGDSEEEKFFPISTNPNLCISCTKCSIRCHSKAIFFKGTSRYVDYNKCKGCLKCVRACKYGAIEVISMKEGKLKGFKIIEEKCKLCGKCLEEDFCFQDLFELAKDENDKKMIQFKDGDFSKCKSCLKCFKDCPENAIIPIIK